MSVDYYNRPEWSFSELSKVITSGIDFAVACKRKIIEQEDSDAFKIGRLIHDDALQQGVEHWVVKKYPEFRTNEAKQWRDEQTVPIVSEDEFVDISSALEQIKTHPLYSTLLCGEGIENEKEMYATVNGVPMRGKADAVKKLENGTVVITDLKTTRQFDKWIRNCWSYNYDMQGATYTTLASEDYDYYIFVVEAVAPYRTAVFHGSEAFIDNGRNKLAKALEEVKKFGDREIDFHRNLTLADTTELGDFSL